jgi:hypothetical protein
VGAPVSERRVPCALCAASILEGAKKCKVCRQWQPHALERRPFPYPRAAIIVTSAVATVMAVMVTSRTSPVGEAPPLTQIAAEPAGTEPSPGSFGPDPVRPPPVAEPRAPKRWKSRELKLKDIHPLDVAFAPGGESVYVSGDDASLREYKLSSGEILHQASVLAKGDEIRLLFDRYVAILRNHPGVGRVPVMDTTRWDRDPVLLPVGRGPVDVIEMPDGESVVTATSDGRRVGRFGLPSGRLLADITLPQATTQLLVVRAEGRPTLAALGSMTYGGRPAGAWLDLFDPAEAPFGASRRSIPVGRDPGLGAVMGDGTAVLLPDHASSEVLLVSVARETKTRTAALGQPPDAAFVMAGDRHGVTLNASTKTASVIDLVTMTLHSTLTLPGEPRSGRLSPDGRTLFVALGGPGGAPRGQGVAVLSGDPPTVVSQLETGKGASRIAVSKDGKKAVVTNYAARSLTILE